MKGFYVFTLAVCLACGAASRAADKTNAPTVRPTAWAQPVLHSRLDNFFRISPSLYRSEQPRRRDIPDLQQLGIRSIFNLRQYHEDDELAETGFNLVRYRSKAGSFTREDLVQALRLIHEAPKPVLVHCWHGSDRTGTVVAGCRIVFEGWSVAEAVEELRFGGFGHHERTFPNLVRLLEETDPVELRRAVLGGAGAVSASGPAQAQALPAPRSTNRGAAKP
jgi:protein tyrosine phosphatase (PTP) superfamily phosphohydrolase (DUF442 family)